MTTSVPSICGCCPAGCGIFVELDGDQVVGVRGDTEHPASHGYLCQKGHRIPWFHHQPARLDHPRCAARPPPGTRASTTSPRSIRAAVDEHGPDAVGVYHASGMTGDTAGMAAIQRFIVGDRHAPALLVDDRRPRARDARAGDGHRLGRAAAHLGARARGQPPRAVRRVQPGGVARLLHDPPRPDSPAARVPTRRRSGVGRRPAPHEDRRARQRSRRTARRHRRDPARLARARAARRGGGRRRVAPHDHARGPAPARRRGRAVRPRLHRPRVRACPRTSSTRCSTRSAPRAASASSPARACSSPPTVSSPSGCAGRSWR